MRILVCNDDGIEAQGIYFLAKELSKLGEVIVVAPDKQRSASGHGITIHDPLRAEKVNFFDTNLEAWAVDGTPTDCVKLAMECLLEKRPDLIVSGINKGPNLGTDVLYSGTVSAAIEGAIFGIPAIAISLASYDDLDYRASAKFAASISERLLKNNPLKKDTLLNINVPNIDEKDIKGVKITFLGKRRYQNNFIKRKDPRGKEYFWLGGDIIEEEAKPGSDIDCVSNMYISITPIHFDLSQYDLIDQLKIWEE
jgi:5'-nucleotidase